MEAEEEAAWSGIDALVRRIQQAERIVIGLPG